jgi:DNA-binding Lrp family transcriptional regulator
MIDLDAIDRALLAQLQSAFPLVPQPFLNLGLTLDLEESAVLERVRCLRETKVIREISAIFDTRRLGYKSTLVAFHVEADRLEAVAACVSAHAGVSHNYARSHHYNLWFTLAIPPDPACPSGVGHAQVMKDEIQHLARRAEIDDWLDLPAERVFKIQARFDFGADALCQTNNDHDARMTLGRPFSDADIPLVRTLQQDLPLVARPFSEAAKRLGMSEQDFLAAVQELLAAGIMRRYGAVLRHREVGYTANGMACWAVPEPQIEMMGRAAARFAAVSHCYQRPAYPPRWPFSVFTMIHGQERSQVEAVAAEIAHSTGIGAYEVLYSLREFKKERLRYFAHRAG